MRGTEFRTDSEERYSQPALSRPDPVWLKLGWELSPMFPTLYMVTQKSSRWVAGLVRGRPRG